MGMLQSLSLFCHTGQNSRNRPRSHPGRGMDSAHLDAKDGATARRSAPFPFCCSQAHSFGALWLVRRLLWSAFFIGSLVGSVRRDLGLGQLTACRNNPAAGRSRAGCALSLFRGMLQRWETFRKMSIFQWFIRAGRLRGLGLCPVCVGLHTDGHAWALLRSYASSPGVRGPPLTGPEPRIHEAATDKAGGAVGAVAVRHTLLRHCWASLGRGFC